jgi:hypothetical protein
MIFKCWDLTCKKRNECFRWDGIYYTGGIGMACPDRMCKKLKYKYFIKKEKEKEKMEKLTGRIQRGNNLNDVFVSEQPEEMFNGVHHVFEVRSAVSPANLAETKDGVLCRIEFQKGPRREVGSVSGVLEHDLLEIVRDRLQGHQKSDYATREGALALTAIEEALLWLAKRADDRFERGVLGTTVR